MCVLKGFPKYQITRQNCRCNSRKRVHAMWKDLKNLIHGIGFEKVKIGRQTWVSLDLKWYPDLWEQLLHIRRERQMCIGAHCLQVVRKSCVFCTVFAICPNINSKSEIKSRNLIHAMWKDLKNLIHAIGFEKVKIGRQTLVSLDLKWFPELWE